MKPTIQVGTMTDPMMLDKAFVTIIATDRDNTIITQMEPGFAAALGRQIIEAADDVLRVRSSRTPP